MNVSVSNPQPVSGPAIVLTFTVNNPVPTLSAANVAGQTHVAAGTGFTLTLTVTNFVSTSVVNFGTSQAITPSSQTATQLQAAIPASDVATAGSVNVTVGNPTPGGGVTPAATFTLDGYSLTGPGAAVTVKVGQATTIPITITPSANGFANQVTFNVTGLPARSTLTPVTMKPGGAKSTVNLMITTTANGSTPPLGPTNWPLPPLVTTAPGLLGSCASYGNLFRALDSENAAFASLCRGHSTGAHSHKRRRGGRLRHRDERYADRHIPA